MTVPGYLVRHAWLLVLVLGAASEFARAQSQHAEMEIRGWALKGAELRLLVESGHHFHVPWRSSEFVDKVRGYYIVIDTAKQGSIETRARVYGPLWDIPNASSSLTFEVGVTFDEKDRKALLARPWAALNPDAELVRIVPDAEGKGWGSDKLVTTDTGFRWERIGPYTRINESTPPGAERRLESLEGRWVVIRGEDHAVRVYNLWTGERVPDEWLESAFLKYRTMKEMGNVVAWLTDDRNWLVIRPEDGWSSEGWDQDHDSRGDEVPPNPHLVTMFEIDGKVYKRKDYVIVFHRPDVDPGLFERVDKSEDTEFLSRGPHFAVEIENQVYLLQVDKRTLTLAKPSGDVLCRTENKLGGTSASQGGAANLMRFDRATKRLIFESEMLLDVEKWDREVVSKRKVDLSIWNLDDSRLTRVTERIADLFEESPEQFKPNVALPAAP